MSAEQPSQPSQASKSDVSLPEAHSQEEEATQPVAIEEPSAVAEAKAAPAEAEDVPVPAEGGDTAMDVDSTPDRSAAGAKEGSKEAESSQ